MNNKGFTLIELMATLVVLGIIVAITFVILNVDFQKTKEKTEEIFVDTIKDALDIYLDSNAKSLNFDTECSTKLNKSHGDVSVYKAITDFSAVINSDYHPITQNDLVNPADEDTNCTDAEDIEISIYRDGDYVYYYKVLKSEFGCLLNASGEYSSLISNLPEGFDC